MADAFEHIAVHHLEKYCAALDYNKWRTEVYWKEECDVLYKLFLKPMQLLYEKFSGAKCTRGEYNYMSRGELLQLASRAGLVNSMCGERDVMIAFNLSKQSQVDELNNENTLKMKYIEFLEAFARIADKASLPRFRKSVEEHWSLEEEMDCMSEEERRTQPIFLKLESAIHLCLRKLIPNKDKFKLVIPKESIFKQEDNKFTDDVRLDFEEVFDYDKVYVNKPKAKGSYKMIAFKMKSISKRFRKKRVFSNVTNLPARAAAGETASYKE